MIALLFVISVRVDYDLVVFQELPFAAKYD